VPTQFDFWAMSDKKVPTNVTQITEKFSKLFTGKVKTGIYCQSKSCENWTLKHRTKTCIEYLLMAQRSSLPVWHLLSFIQWLSEAESYKITQSFLLTLHDRHRFTSSNAVIGWWGIMQRLRTQALYLSITVTDTLPPTNSLETTR